MKINHDLEEHPLQIKTSSTVGSEEQVYVKLYTADVEQIGNIELRFYSTLYYTITSCSSGYITADLLPAEHNKTWTIRKTATAIRITCNDVLVVNMQYYDYSSSCATTWSKDVEKLYFSSADTASDWYREKPAGK